MKRDLVRSLAIGLVVATAVPLALAVCEVWGAWGLGEYLFVFAVVPYGLTEAVAGGLLPSRPSVLVGWAEIIPAGVAFYWPVCLLALTVRRMTHRPSTVEA